MITQDELKILFSYDAETGLFTWLVSTAKRVKIGDIAGSKNNKGYIHISINNKKYSAHRLAWLYEHGSFPTKQIDHINGVKDDNRLCNLREATRNQNLRNRGKLANNKSGFKGVRFHKEGNKWEAQSTFNSKVTYLGLFDTPELASQAYQEFAMKNYGEFYHE